MRRAIYRPQKSSRRFFTTSQPVAMRQADSDIEGRFSITKVEPGRIWLQDDDDGEDYGPILLTEKATKLCRVGWTISGAVRKSGNRCVLVEAFQVYP